MSEKAYKVASPEGVAFAARFGLEVEEGDEVELDLGMQETETAVLAAGWLEAASTKKKKEA